MKKTKVRNYLLLACLFFGGGILHSKSLPVTAEDSFDWSTVFVYGKNNVENTKIYTQEIGEENVMVLPSTVTPNAVALNWEEEWAYNVTVKGEKGSVQITNGEVVNLSEICSEDNYELIFQVMDTEDTYDLEIYFSSNVDSMYLISDNPAEQGREWVESSADKSNKATGSMTLLKADGTEIYNGALSQIKGRGNSTWNAFKKPYQIKLDKKADLLETGNDQNKTKTWVLLANYYDPAFMRNTIALNPGKALGMETYIENKYVDLYYDGEYRGCYLLSEKVEVGSGRVDITDMEELNEEANPEVEDLEEFTIKTAITENGATYTYCEGMKSPDDVTGGYLLEMDYAERAVEEACYFYTSRDNYVVVKSPEFASQEEMNYIATLYQEYEDAVYNGGVNSQTGKSYTEYVDLQSTVQCYLINEFTKNIDSFKSSTYLYKDAGEDIMTMGPLWDYDLSMGMNSTDYSYSVSPEGLNINVGALGSELCKLPDFRKTLKIMYADELYPLITSVLLGDEAVSVDGTLHSMAHYMNLIKNSALCDNVVWKREISWKEAYCDLKEFVECRAEYLNKKYAAWPDEYNQEVAFIDVTEGDWYYDEVCDAFKYGLMQGVDVLWFDPEAQAERSHVAQTVYNMADAAAVPFEKRFTDVEQTDWFADSVIWAAQEEIVQGYPDGKFCPDTDVSRQDIMVLLYRYCGSPEVEGDYLDNFSDQDQISDYARAAMQWAVCEGMMEGYPDNTIRPQDTAIRAELAAILVRYYETQK